MYITLGLGVKKKPIGAVSFNNTTQTVYSTIQPEEFETANRVSVYTISRLYTGLGLHVYTHLVHSLRASPDYHRTTPTSR